jgi:hypothetical protein
MRWRVAMMQPKRILIKGMVDGKESCGLSEISHWSLKKSMWES